MLQLILLIVGVLALVRYPKLARLTNADFPDHAPEAFARWHAAQLVASKWLIAASIGWFGAQLGLGLVIGFVLGMSGLPSERISTVGDTFGMAMVGVWLILLVFCAHYDSKVRKVRKETGIRWPARGRRGQAATAA
jgi:hypothetical protein